MSFPPDSRPRPTDPSPPGATAATDLIATLVTRITELQELVVSQAARIGELERRLGLNSGNSGNWPRSLAAVL